MAVASMRRLKKYNKKKYRANLTLLDFKKTI